MMYNDRDIEFIENLAKSQVGTDLIGLLKKIEVYYADIRNLQGTEASVRVDSLKLLREALLDKLLVLSGKQEAPDLDEYH